MVGWHHRLDGHKFEQVPGVGDGQGSLACCSPWGHKESEKTKQLKGTELSKNLRRNILSKGLQNMYQINHTLGHKATSTHLKELKSYRMCSLTQRNQTRKQ